MLCVAELSSPIFLPTQDVKTAFSSPANSMLRTMMLTLGEFDFDSLFFNTDEGGSDPVNGTDPNALPQEVLYPGASYFLWIVFVIMMPIVLTNLLVCIQCVIQVNVQSL